MGMNILVEGKGGEQIAVQQGVGLGVRQHDDVMLSWGYSHKVTKIVEIPAGDFVVISLTVPSGLSHHAEARIVGAYNGILETRVILGLTPAQLPAVVEQLPAFNEKGPYRNDNVQSIFEYRGIHTSDPLNGLYDEQNSIDQIHLHATTGQGVNIGGVNTTSNVSGRYYEEGTYVFLAENVSNATVELTYIYSWHEF